MKQSQFEGWVRQIFATQREEISCSVCLDECSQCVEWEIAGEADHATLARVKQHLAQCRVCREEYETLLDLTRLERDGHAPSPDELRRSFS